ncbi:hypothetical protein EH221_04400 [bacterium]|nr:MAG: hypothetical protein EH221_04400 [bacterium]
MELTDFSFRLIILMFPGIVCSVIYRKLKGAQARKDWEDLLEIVVFSILSYLGYQIIIQIISYLFSYDLKAFENIFDIFLNNATPGWIDILGVTIVGSVLAFIASYSYNHYFINRLGKLLHVTNRHGDEDGWSYFHNSPETKWVLIRDFKNDLIYYGGISHFSESGFMREIILSGVDIYLNSTGEFLYKADKVYLELEDYSYAIEIPVFPQYANQ